MECRGIGPGISAADPKWRRNERCFSWPDSGICGSVLDKGIGLFWGDCSMPGHVTEYIPTGAELAIIMGVYNWAADTTVLQARSR